MKIAIVHDYLNQHGGAEKLLETFKFLYPQARMHALYHNKKTYQTPSNWDLKTTFLQNLPKLLNHKFYFPLFPFATKTFNFDTYDFVLTSSHAYVKNIKKPKNTLHICYCHTPMRYAWDLKEQYLQQENFFLKPFISIFLKILAYWDKKNTKQVDYFIANSGNVKQRINQYYGREAEVIYPFVDCKKYQILEKKDNFYLIVSRLISAKKIDLAIKAFNKNGKKLLIIGTGTGEKQLKKLAKSNITFLGFLEEKEVISYYQHAKALIFPGIEDFGMTPIEAQACGTPVIAYSEGGALETIIEGKTGCFFNQQTTEALDKAIQTFETTHFKPKDCRKNALKFDKKIFEKKIKQFITKKYEEHKNAQ
tara:strand:- start:498 stop:1589 length:1092 start_codon:yes stop_codon:yes gene_type:complete